MTCVKSRMSSIEQLIHIPAVRLILAGTLLGIGAISGCSGGPRGSSSSSPSALPAPTFLPASGTYTASQQVTISDATPGATIHYTTDGSSPTSSSSVYSGPISISASETLVAIAIASGFTESPEAQAAYCIPTKPASSGPIAIPAPGYINTVAGPSVSGYNCNQLIGPTGVAVDLDGNIYIADPQTQHILRVTASSSAFSTVAGDGTVGPVCNYVDNNQPAIDTQVNNPNGVGVDTAGNFYIADTKNQRIRMVKVSTGISTQVAGIIAPCIVEGSNGFFYSYDGGYNGDNILGINAELNVPDGMAVDRAGNIYIADTSNQRIRMVAASTGIISTVAGNGTSGYNGDNILATSAELNGPTGVAVDSAGNIYIADTSNQRVRMVTVSTGIISTVAGNGTSGYNGDNILATNAELNNPAGVAVDSAGNLYIADSGNNSIRVVNTK